VPADRTEPTLSAARLTVAARRARVEAATSAALMMAEPIAIAGVGCRFPGGADSPVAYWQFLAEGRSGIRQIPEGRWPHAQEILKPYLLLGGYLDGIDRFDPEFFGIAPREAPSIDPQQRLLLEVCWEALADAGIAPSSLSGAEAGVFISIYNSDYSRMQLRDGAPIDAYTSIGTAHSVAAGRLSFLLNLRGPCLVVDTACSSSLVATHLACQSLRKRECSLAFVGGSSLKLLPDEVRVFAEWGMLSSDGRAKTFDASADGFVPGEGCGVVVLKRLSDAIAQGDRIRAVIRGSAINHDGRSSVLTAPRGPAQEAVIREALKDAQIRPGDVSFIETHGTGTSLGDPIEVEALDAVYGTATASENAICTLGAVKTNFGHLEAAAGIAGLIKVALAFENQEIPRNLNFKRLNPQIHPAQESRLRIAAEALAWPRTSRPRFAAVSSFGLGGTNAHVVLEEAPLLPSMRGPSGERKPLEYCLPISAHSPEALRILAAGYIKLLRQPEADLARVASAAARNRDHNEFRFAVTGSTAQEAAERLEAKIASMPADASDGFEQRSKLAFVFSGQGSVWSEMLPALMTHFQEAEDVFATCDRLVQEIAGWSLRTAASDALMLEDTAKAQPVLFATQMALVAVLESWGIRPDAVTGHSVGEIAAAVVAGVISLEQALRLVMKRGMHMGAARPADQEEGRMLAAVMSIADGTALLAEMYSSAKGAAPEIAAINAPRSIVFSGPQPAMQTLADELNCRRISNRWLDVQYAFHSSAMDKASCALEADLGGETQAAKHMSIPLVSTVTGKSWVVSDGDAAYWSRGIRRPVQFHHAVDRLFELGCETFLEIGPHPVLLRAVSECAAARSEKNTGTTVSSRREKVVTTGCMRRGQSARVTLMATLAVLYESGAAMKWQNIYPGPPTHARLPPYPWNKQRYWLPDFTSASMASSRRSGSDDLPGNEISSHFVEGQLWEVTLGTEGQPWLAEHRWHNQPIFPFAAWLETARRAASIAAGDPHVAIREFAVHRRLLLGTNPVTLQTLITKQELKLAVRTSGEWRDAASGYWEIARTVTHDAVPRLSAEVKKKQATRIIPPEELYQELSSNGLDYGPMFRLLQSVHAGDGFALGEIASLPASVSTHSLHPAQLDACLQLLQAAQPAKYRSRPVLPVSIGSYRVLQSAAELSVLVEMRSSSAEGAEADVTITDRLGALVAEIRALRIRRVEALTDTAPMWQTIWQPAAEEFATPAGASPSPWLMSTPAQNNLIPRTLCALIPAGESHGLSFSDLSEWKATSAPAANVLLAGSLHSVMPQMLRVVVQEQQNPGAVKRICLLTRGAQQARPGEMVDPDQAALSGIVRTFRAEYPGIAVYLFDLPHGNAAARESHFESGQSTDAGAGMAAEEAKQIAQWLAARSAAILAKSEEIALRNGRLYHPRLAAYREERAATGERVLVIQTPGLLESLHQVPVYTPEPEPDEVQIGCFAHGLNFRDVLTAIGSYAGASASLGGECAGVVIRAGNRSGIATGAQVIAFAPKSLRTTVNVRAAYVVPKPATMSFAEAATIPVAFLTAHYAFSRLARLQPGETVLIHSAAGGLGQAAVQLALMQGATVIATAGNPEKRAYLHAQGIAEVFDSRSDRFADDVLHATGGQGVDVVLNALSGEKIAAGFRALRQGGSFLEAGKRDIWTPNQAAQVRPDVNYQVFDLGEVAEQVPPLVAAMWQELLPAFVEGRLSPLPHEIYPIAESKDAFRYMASGKHTGKLILMQPQLHSVSETWAEALHEGTVLITGGTGALGIATTRWLLDQGARSIVLVSRKGMNEAVEWLQAELSAQGIRLSAERADVADRGQLADVLRRIRSHTGAPLKVVIHAAGEADDHLLSDQSESSFIRGMRTKTDGARLLDDLTSQDVLTATIYYSSVAALLGSAGQASYAAANAFLDGLAEIRTARGLPTLSVNWGAWAGGGMVERLSASASARLDHQGIALVPPASALAALKDAIFSGLTRITIADVDWSVYREQFPMGSPSRAFFAEYLPNIEASRNEFRPSQEQATPAPIAVEAIKEICAAARSERVPLMEAFVRASARKVLGLSASRPLPTEMPLQDLGLDSLMALELRNMLAQAASRPLSAALLFDYPAIRSLSQYLLALLIPDKKEQGTAENSSGEHETASPSEGTELSAISETEAEELLLAELDRKGRR
jgi:acyl transferase domain-containing protein/NADPH:quinone reductase-like Zn-dependent oxidoreductase